MAAATEPRLLIQSGHKLEGLNAAHRTFFTYITPTGVEQKISMCPTIKLIGSQITGAFGTPGYKNSEEYVLRGRGRLKMVCLTSSFGKPKMVANIYIDIGLDLDVIELHGLGHCGGFFGRGKLLLTSSSLRSNRIPVPLTPEVIKKAFEYQVAFPNPDKQKDKRARNLIF